MVYTVILFSLYIYSFHYLSNGIADNSIMSDIREQLVEAKKNLVNVLGENEKLYWSNLKSWFKHKVSKEEFDCEARRLLPKHLTHLHNEFLLAVLTKCHLPSIPIGPKDSSGSQYSSKIKKSKRLQGIKRKFDHRFNINQPPIDPPIAAWKAKDGKSIQAQQPIKACSKTFLLPSVEEMKNYVSVIAWEMGLDDAADDVMPYTTEAVRIFLKNLLSAIFSRRSAYKTVNQTFKYSMGCQPENPYLRRKRSLFSTRLNSNSVPGITYDMREQDEIEELGRVDQYDRENKTPINLYDLYHTLKVFGASVIPSHTVYSLASERIVANLWHPDHNEIKQDRIMMEIMKA